MVNYLKRQILIVVVVVLVILPVTIGHSATAAEPSDSLAFSSATTTAARGDVATIDIQTTPGRTTLITIRGATTKYKLQTAIVDQNGDGKVALQINTHLVGRVSDPMTAVQTGGRDRVKYATRPSPQRSEPLPAGRYNVIISIPGNSIAGTLRLVNGSVAGGATFTASSVSTTSIGSQPARRGEVVAGDVAIARFNVSGIGALIHNPPAENKIYPADSTPGAKTTHRIRLRPSQNLTLRTATINYNAGDGGVPANVLARTTKSPSMIGVDVDTDGVIEREVGANTTSVSTVSGNQFEFKFEEGIPLNVSDTLYLRISATNPPIHGRDTVTVSLNGGSPTSGEVTYGVAGSGTLGYGVDLRFRALNMTVANPLAGVDLLYDNKSHALIVMKPTDSIKTGEQAAFSLRLLETYPYGNASFAGTTFTIAPPQAQIRSPHPNIHFSDRIRLRATTNLAPGNRVDIKLLFGNGTGGGLISTQVNSNQEINDTISIPQAVDSSEITAMIVFNGTVISRPRTFIAHPDTL